MLNYIYFTLQKYVQTLLEDEGAEVTRMLVYEDGHFYVCGDCKMAEEVQQKLKSIVKKHACMSDREVEEFILEMMVGTFPYSVYITAYFNPCNMKRCM